MKRTCLLSLLILLTLPLPWATAQELRNQLQNSSFEEDWLVSSALARRRWGLIARSEDGYGGADGKIDHWEAPCAWWDRANTHRGKVSVKLTAGRKLSQAVRVAMRSPAGGNPAGQQTDFQPLLPADLAKLEKRRIKGGAWIKATELPEDKAKIVIVSGKNSAQVAIPAGTYDWRWVEVASPEPWPAAAQMSLTIDCLGGTVWVDDALLAEVPLGKNLLGNGDLETLDAKGWPIGFSGPEAFWWFRFDYYGWTGWGHDGGYGCQIPQRIDLVPGYRWRGHAAVDSLVSHSGQHSLRLVAYPGDNFGVLGPVVDIDGNQPFEIGAWVRADRIHQIELMAVNADTNEYLLMDSDHFAGLEAVGVNAGSKGQGTYDWTYLRKLVCPRNTSKLKRIRPMMAVRGFDGRIIEKNIVGTVWFDDLEVIQRGGDTPTPSAPPAKGDVRIVGLDLGDRLWGKNIAAVTLLSGADALAQVKLTLSSPKGIKQEVEGQAKLTAGKPVTVDLAYRIDHLCAAWNEQYAVELAVTVNGKTRTLNTAFGTPSSLLSTRSSHQFLFPEEKLVLAANLQVSRQSLAELSQVVLQVIDSTGKAVAQTVVDPSAGNLPILTPGAETIKHLNIDRCVTMIPDLQACTIRPWKEATRDYTVMVRLLAKDGKELARAQGVQFGRITHFDPPELTMTKIGKDRRHPRYEFQGKVTVNDEHFLQVDGKPFFPVYFGEFGDTFRFEEGVNITRDQLANLGVNPLLLSAEEKTKYGMTKNFGEGEWDLNGMMKLNVADIRTALDKLRADHPGKLVVSGYDMISHPGSRRAAVAKYYFPAYDIGCMECSFAAYVPNLKVDYFPAMQGKKCAILVGYEHYYFLSYDDLRYRSYLSVMRGAAGLGLIPSRMMEGRPECNNYLRGMNAECRSLAPVFAAPFAKEPTQTNMPGLFTWEKEFAGKRYLFVVRGEPFLTRGLFQWTERQSPGGQRTHSEPATPRLAQHWAENTRSFDIAPGDKIVQEVFIEGKAPRMIALQFRTGQQVDHTWEHRAYWGKADLQRFVGDATYPQDQKPPAPWPAWMVVENPPQPINSAADRGSFYFDVLGGAACQALDGASSLKRQGDVPAVGRWLTLTIPAKDVGLEGRRLDGIGFAVDGGQVFWGKTSVSRADGKETVLIDGSLDALSVDPGDWLVKYHVPGAKNIAVRSLFENVQLAVEGNQFSDRMPLPFRARIYEIAPR